MNHDALRKPSRQALRYAMCYALWIGLSAFAVWLVFQLRVNLVDLAFFVTYAQNLDALGQVIHHFGMLVLALLCMAFVVFLEGHLRDGVAKGELGRRVLGVALILLCVLGLSYGFQYVAEHSALPVRPETS